MRCRHHLLLSSNRQHRHSRHSRLRARTRLGRRASRKARTRSELNRLGTQAKCPRYERGWVVARRRPSHPGKGAKQKSKQKEKFRPLKGAGIDSHALVRIGFGFRRFLLDARPQYSAVECFVRESAFFPLSRSQSRRGLVCTSDRGSVERGTGCNFSASEP